MHLPAIDEYPDRYRFHYCPRCATVLELVVLHELQRQRCPACGWIHYPLPNLAATVVIEYQGGIVLVQRDIDPDRGIWHLPIGHVEYGEEPAAAALREGHEETGLLLAGPRFLTYTHGRSYGDPRLFYLVLSFAAHAVGGALTGSIEGRNTQVLPLAVLPPLKWTSQQQAIEVYRRQQAAASEPDP